MKKPRSIRRGGRLRRRLRIIITAGPTREHIDPVRFISNASSGKMGYAIAEAGARAGHEVILISGPVALDPPSGVRTIRVTSAAEMSAATRRAFRGADTAIFSAAVSDYRPADTALSKAPKSSRGRGIVLVPTEDIAAVIGRIKGPRVTIGFALEDHAGRAHAEQKLRRKRFDAIILNGPDNIGAEMASVEFLVKGGSWSRWPTATKRAIARRIIAELQRLIDARS